MKKKKTYNYEDYEEFDELECIKNEEGAKIYIGVSVMDSGLKITVERVDDAWDVVNQASARHGFPITPAITSAYAAARAKAEAHVRMKKGRAGALVKKVLFTPFGNIFRRREEAVAR